MKIAHVTSNLQSSIGGAENYLVEIAKAQALRGDTVQVLTSRISPTLRTDLNAAGIKVHILKRFRPYSPGARGRHFVEKVIFHLLDIVDSVFQKDIASLEAKEKFDVVHWHRFQGLGLSVPKTKTALHLITIHDHSLMATSSLGNSVRKNIFETLRKLFYARTLKRMGFIVFPSQSVFFRHVEFKVVRELDSKNVILGHGWKVGIPQIVEIARQKSSEGVKYLYLGALSEQKGFRTMLDAWEEIPESNSVLTIAGLGPLEHLVRAKSSNRTRYVGWVDGEQKVKLLKSHDLVIVPSLVPEVFCLVIAEATILGVPVICSNLARPVYLEPEKSCLEFQWGDRNALAKLILKTEYDKNLISTLRYNLAQASALLDFDTHVNRLRDIYSQSLTNGDLDG